MYLRPSGHIYGRDFNTLSVALATGYRSARSASRLGSRRGRVPVRSARTPQFEERVYQWSRRHRKGSACGCGFRQGRVAGLRPAVRAGGRGSLACAPRFPAGVGAERGTIGNGAIRGSPAFRRAVPGPTGRTAQRSAFPCLRAALARGGTCRDGRHTGTGRYVVRPPFGGRCRPGGRRSLACVLSERAAVRGLVVDTNRVQRKNPGARWPRGSRLI